MQVNIEIFQRSMVIVDDLGTIDFNDFLQLMSQKMAEKDSKEEILKAFR